MDREGFIVRHFQIERTFFVKERVYIVMTDRNIV